MFGGVFFFFNLSQTTVLLGIATSQVSFLTCLPTIATVKIPKSPKDLRKPSVLLSFPLFLLFSLTKLFLFFILLIPSLLCPGGRGSYNDMGGPVITTQVTIPKDVSKTINLNEMHILLVFT